MSTEITSIRITAEREIARRKELADIYHGLMTEANDKQEQSSRIKGYAERIRLLINDSEVIEKGDTIPTKSEAQRRRDAIRTLKSVVANLEKD